MKYELSDLLNDKYKYGLTLLRMHGKANKNILSFLIMKIIICDNILIYILFIIISSLGLLIICSDFIPDYKKYNYLSIWLRYLTPFFCVIKLNLSNHEYISICCIIFIICILRLIYMSYFIYKINHFHSTQAYNIKMNIFILVLNHIVFVFFSYIIEFLSFIYYIEIIPNDFIIKKDSKINEIINILFCILNLIFIIIYNFNNYIFIALINKPTNNSSFSFRMKLPILKLYILIGFQNASLFHPIQCFVRENTNKMWIIIFKVIIFLILLWIYFICIKIFYYNNIFSSIICFIGEFCFISIIIEFIIFLTSIKHKNNFELIAFTFIKLVLTLCLYFLLQNVYHKLMMKKIKKRLFYNNPHRLSFDNKLIDSILFIREIFEEKNMELINKLIEYYSKHKKQCINYNCGCKLIKIKNNIKEGQANFIDEIINKLNYFIETILIFYNYQNNFGLSLLLAEHFLIFKNNPIMSYSILQTLIHYNYRNLNKKQLIIIYEAMNKYINFILEAKNKKIYLEEFNRNNSNINIINRENEIKKYINLILKINKATKIMINYSSRFINIIRHKENYENSTIAKINEESNEIKYISSSYLKQKIITKLLDYISEEIIYTSDIKKYLYDLKEYKKLLSYEFLYKIFLFVDYFWNRKIPDNLINIFYAFTSNRNLYSSKVNSNIYIILEIKHNELLRPNKRKYYILFKYTKGLRISYASESLIQKLNFKNNKLINNEIDSLLIKELSIPHNNAIKHFFIFKQNYLLKDKFKFIFDSKKLMIKTKMDSTLQIGINKNILIICIFQNERNNEMYFYTDKNLKIISINNHFLDGICLSLPLIEEFKIELKDIFGIDIFLINNLYKKEFKKIKKIRENKLLDTKEYILKNLFKYDNQNNTYTIHNNMIINDDSNDYDSENEEKAFLKGKKNINNLFNDKLDILHLKSIDHKIDKEHFLLNYRKIFEKIGSYELDKLERKNIYNDYLRFNLNYNILNEKPNLFFFNIHMQPRLIYDSIFYYCKIDKYILENILEIRTNTLYETYELKNNATETDELNSSSGISFVKNHGKKEDKISKMYKDELKMNDEDKMSEYEKAIKSSFFFREQIKKRKPSKDKLFPLLILCIISLLISCIITYNYQTNLIQKNGKIFKVIYYNYYQRAHLIFLNSIILSIYFELVNISNQDNLEDNKDVLRIIGENMENSHQLFEKFFLDVKIELNEDFSKLYEPLNFNEISVNWENFLVYNSYHSQIFLIIYKIMDSVKHNFTLYDIIDCENFLLSKYLTIDKKNTPAYGNFIKLIYSLYMNYESNLRKYFLDLEDSFDESLNNYAKNTTFIIIIIDIIGIILFILVFIINAFFFINSNSYIFQNILYMFIDFTHSKDYLFNNKKNNFSIINKVSNYILLLKEFSKKNLDSLKCNKEIKTFINLKTLLEKEKKDTLINSSAILSNRIKNKVKKNKLILADRTKSNKKLLNTFSLFKKSDKSIYESNINIKSDITKNTNNNSKKNSNNNINKSKIKLKEVDDGIHILNNKELNDISNNSFMNNSKNDSTNIILISSFNNSSEIKNNQNQKKKEIKLTIEKILFQTKINMLYSIKLIIIAFIIFTIIFIIYYIYKLITTLLFISNFKSIINDFKTLTSQYNHIARYWNLMKTLFILPNATIYYDFSETEKYFYNLNNRVYNIYNSRIKKYKKISALYNNILSPSILYNLSKIDFCMEHKLCHEIKHSNIFLLSKGLESTVNLYSKEIANYYKIYLLSKSKIICKDDIINNFINERYEILNDNINHIYFFLELIFFKYFLEDEEEIINNYYLKIKILNIIEICYCFLLNLFFIFFVYNFIIRITLSVEVSSERINHSILRMKIQNNDDK